MTLNQLLQKLEATSPILQANFGIERESLRVDRQGQLVHTPHPSCLGARSFHPYIQTDFCEFQMELITPVAKSTIIVTTWLKNTEPNFKLSQVSTIIWNWVKI